MAISPQQASRELMRRKRVQAAKEELNRREMEKRLKNSSTNNPLIEAAGALLEPLYDNRDEARGAAEVAATIGSGIVAEPVAGVAGLLASGVDGTKTGAEVVEATRDSMTYQPKSEEGQRRQQSVGEFFQPVGEVFESIEKAAGQYALNKTGSPEWATIAHSTPTLLMEAVGLGSLKKIRGGTRLIDDQGRPTQVLQLALDKQGLEFDLLSPEVREAIPIEADATFIPKTGDARARDIAEDALIGQLEAGGRDDVLAAITIRDGSVQGDGAARIAMEQGFTPGTVQSVKTANPATRERMLEMVRIRRQLMLNESLETRLHPAQVTGDSLGSRLGFLRDQANSARLKLDNMAQNDLPGRFVDVEPILNEIYAQFAKYKIGNDAPRGERPVPQYAGSLISKDKSSQNVINDALDLLSQGGMADAVRLHDIKRQLDTMLDFRKKTEGLSDAGEKVAKALRRQINQSLRVIPEYAAVNDVMHQSLRALDDFQIAIGRRIDLFGENADRAMGTRARSILSNAAVSQQSISNAISLLDDTALRLGGNFPEDIRDLISFGRQLDTRFGAASTTSLMGDVQAANEQLARRMMGEGGVRQKAVDLAANVYDRIRGVDELGSNLAAIRAMEQLLRRQEPFQSPPRTPPPVSDADFGFDPDTGLLNDNR